MPIGFGFGRFHSSTVGNRLFSRSFLAGLHDGGALLTVRGSIHTSFTDGPSDLTGLGRSLIGCATVGSISVQDMTEMTDDTIAAFAGPALARR